MASAKLKNIILLILLVTNALLLGLLVYQRTETRQYRQKALNDAVALLEERGIAVRSEDLPDRDFPDPMLLKPDQEGELAVFTKLLGPGTTCTQRGLVFLYDGPNGQAEVRENGGFTAELKPGVYPLAPGQDIASHALETLSRHLDFSGQSVFVQNDAVTAVQTLEGSPVFSCQAVLSYQDGSLVSMAGTRLSGLPAADTQAGKPLSTATLLVRFRAGLINSGDACTAIRSATQGYVLSGEASGALKLTPVLRLETDTNLYIVNALSGELRRG